MPTEWTTVPVPLDSSVDTITDEHSIGPASLVDVENGVYNKRGILEKRPGYDLLRAEDFDEDSIQTAEALLTRDDELLLASGAKLYSRGTAADAWHEKGPFYGCRITTEKLSQDGNNQTAADYAEVGGIGVYAWEDSRGGVYCSVVDSDTGAFLVDENEIDASAEMPRVVTVGSVIHVYYAVSTNIKVVIISPSDPSDLTGIVTVVSDSNATHRYDVIQGNTDGTVAFMAYQPTTAGDIKFTYVEQNGAVGDGSPYPVPESVTYAATIEAVSVARSPVNGDLFVAVARTSEHRVYKVPHLSISSSSVFYTEAAVSGNLKNIGIVVGGVLSSVTYVFWEEDATDVYNHVVLHKWVVDGGVTIDGVFSRHCGLGSKPWLLFNEPVVCLTRESPLQSSYYVATTEGSGVSAVFIGRALSGVGNGLVDSPHLPQVTETSPDVFKFPAIARVRLEADGDNLVFTDPGIEVVTLDFARNDRYRSVEFGEATYVSGGILWEYDGGVPVEQGFLEYPEPVDADKDFEATFGSGGSMGAGGGNEVYQYRFYWEWDNDRGEREQSTTARVVTITFGVASDNEVTFTVPTLAFTNKQGSRDNVRLAVYRTEANPSSDSPYYRVTSLDPTATGANGYVSNDPSSDTISFNDEMSDADLITKELDYQNTGELDNVHPQSPFLLAQNKDRVFGVIDERRVQFSKTRQAGKALEWNDTQIIEVDSEGGPITALGILSDALVIFKRSSVYIVIGDGPNNLGGGTPYSLPQRVVTDVGCTDGASIVETPQGLMFKSAKGIYLLDRSFQPQYIGAPVDAYNDQDVSAATLVDDRNEVRFLTSSGRTLVYNYLFGKWSTFTFEGVDALVWRNKYVRARSNGEVYVENGSKFTDGGFPYRLLAETGWLKFGDIQGYQQVRNMWMLGDWRSSHTLQIDFAHSGWDNWTHRVQKNPEDFLSISVYGDGLYGSGLYGGGNAVYQMRVNMPRRKSESVKLRFFDLNPTGESLAFRGLLFRVRVKQYGTRLPAAQTVG